MVDGVPLPEDPPPARTTEPAWKRQWTGVWAGAWGGALRHILVVEDIADDGQARVVYAVGALPAQGIDPAWNRHAATVTGGILTIANSRFSATYILTDLGAPPDQATPTDRIVLEAAYARGNARARAVMMRADPAAMARPGAVPAWTRGRSELVPTDLTESGAPARLEIVTFRPPGAGPFPLAVILHGSTGRGTDPALFGATWTDETLALFLNARGWLAAFPQRRGRGRSDGLYDEGFRPDRARGYTCDPAPSLAGAARALTDVRAAIDALRRRPDVAPGRVLMGGASRGGVLAVAHAGAHPDEVAGVLNFVGGWISDRCPRADLINAPLFEAGGGFPRPVLWLYGDNDPYYALVHSQANFAAFRRAGGLGRFLAFDMPDGRGHAVLGYPDLWKAPVAEYLDLLAAPAGK